MRMIGTGRFAPNAKRLLTAGLALAVVLAGCGSESTAIHGTSADAGLTLASDGTTTGQDGAGEVSATGADAIDAVNDGDAAGSEDGADSVQVPDVLADTLLDTGAGGDAEIDSGADSGADSAVAETANLDTGPVDSGGGVCSEKASAFASQEKKALVCDTPFQCWRPGPAKMLCGCQKYYSDKTLDWQSLTDLEAEAKKAGCTGQCDAKETCAPFATQVGVCTAGACETITPTCKQLDQMASDVLAEGKKCKVDADCKFLVLSSLVCGCPTFISMTTMGPAKPLFNYLQSMLNKAYKELNCGLGVTDCACVTPASATCVAGMCKDGLP